MKISKMKKGLYSVTGSKLATKIIIEFNETIGKWYAFNIENGQVVVYGESDLCDVVNKLE